MKNNQLLIFLVLILGLAGCAAAPVETAESSASTPVAGPSTPVADSSTPVAESSTPAASAAGDSTEVVTGLAVENADTAPLADVVSAEYKNAVICRKERVTGSHFPQKVCRTRGEIDALREENQRALNRNNSTGFGANGPEAR